MARKMKVIRQEPEFAVPTKPTKFESKELSDIDDQQVLRIQFPFIMSFREKNDMKKGQDPAKVIKLALAEALVYLYPFAGRLREGPNRKLIVDCNDEGVLFVEGDADISLEEIQDQILPPCPLLEELLFDVPGSSGIIGCPLLLFQVTRLMCGGFILTVRVNHTMCDLYGVWLLLKAMTEISRGAEIPSIIPLWERELLCARFPPKVTCTHHEYEEVAKDKMIKHKHEHEQFNKEKCNNMVHIGFFFGPKEIQAIRNHLPSNLQQSSTIFELLCACLWRCRTIALQPDPEENVRLTIAFNIRGRDIISLPLGYYGNTIVFPAIVTKAKDLIRDESLAYPLQLMKETKDIVSEEYVRSVTDLMVTKGRPNINDVLNWSVSNIMRIGLENVDHFGWGTPLYCGIPRALSFTMTNFTRFKNDKGENVIAVPLCLPMEAMLRFQKELEGMIGKPSHRLHLLSPTYVRSML